MFPHRWTHVQLAWSSCRYSQWVQCQFMTCVLYSLNTATDCTHSTQPYTDTVGTPNNWSGENRFINVHSIFLNILSQCAVWVRIWVLMARVRVRVLRVRVRVLCIRVRVLTKGLESESESLKIWTRVHCRTRVLHHCMVHSCPCFHAELRPRLSCCRLSSIVWTSKPGSSWSTSRALPVGGRRLMAALETHTSNSDDGALCIVIAVFKIIIRVQTQSILLFNMTHV